MRVLTISKPYVAAAYRQKLSLLANAGYTIGLICPPAWGSQRFEPDATDAQYWLRQLPILANGRNHFHVYIGLAKAVKEFRPDIVNCEEEHYSLVTRQCLGVAQDVGAKFIFHTWQNILKAYPPPFSWMERRVLRDAAAAATGNDEATQVLRAKGFRGPIAEIPQMGVHFETFAADPDDLVLRQSRRSRLGLHLDAYYVAFVGRLVEEKGVDMMVAALAQLSHQIPQLRLLILGGGPEQVKLAAMATSLGVADRIDWRSQVPSSEVATYLQATDILCLPSLTRPNWKEQFGRVLVEAMAASAIVIGSSSGEIPRVIGDAGLVFPEGDARALANAIVKTFDSTELRQRLRHLGHQKAHSQFSNEQVAKRWSELWQLVGAI
ncbi:MAG: glycosyltransferase family 4 protein [Deltaproteobacteria bacterium]|nr:glycosyltransferase family 4 protein [Deltaproteobacteria bacterium]